MAEQDGAENGPADRGRPVWDYLAFMAWCGPAWFFTTFAAIILVPKMRQLLDKLGPESQGENFVRFFRLLYELLAHYFLPIAVGCLALLVLLELFAKWWPPRRRALLEIFAWVVNFSALFGMALLVLAALMIASGALR